MKSTSTVEVQVTNKWRLDLHDQTQGCDWSTSHGWFGSHRGREHPAVFSSMLLILFEKTFVSFSSNIFQAKICLHTEFFECFFCQWLVMFFPNATIEQYPSIFPKSIESTQDFYLMKGYLIQTPKIWWFFLTDLQDASGLQIDADLNPNVVDPDVFVRGGVPGRKTPIRDTWYLWTNGSIRDNIDNAFAASFKCCLK